MTEKAPPKIKQENQPDNADLFVLLLAALAHDGLDNADPQALQGQLKEFFKALSETPERFEKGQPSESSGKHRVSKRQQRKLSRQFNNRVINISEDTPARDAFRDALSASIRATSEDLHGTKYKMGGKDARGIDCSGFVAKAVSDAVHMAQSLKIQQEGQIIEASFSNNVSGKFRNNSEGQLAAMIKEGVPVMRENQLNAQTIKGGMVIAMDTGQKSFDRGRTYGIDHVVITSEDERGQVWIHQSSGGKGVNTIKAEDWLAKWNAKGAHLYAADLVDVAHIATEPAPQMAQKVDKRAEFKNNLDASEPTKSPAPKAAPEILIDHNA